MDDVIYRWPKAAEVSYSDGWVFVRGWLRGLLLLDFHRADRTRLATRRQLRAKGLRPGGQEPVALLRFRHRASYRRVFAELFLIEKAKPVRAMTPARQAAVEKALRARRTCRECGEEALVELPKPNRMCEACRAEVELIDPISYLHDYVQGEPTLTAAEHAELDSQLAPVIPIKRHRSPAAEQEAVSA